MNEKKYKLGDRVVFKQDYGGWPKGTIATIVKIGYNAVHVDKTYNSSSENCFLADDEFELETPLHVYKIGDKVEFLESYGGWPKGTEATVTYVGSGTVTVNKSFANVYVNCTLTFNQIRHIPKDDNDLFKIGDIIVIKDVSGGFEDRKANAINRIAKLGGSLTHPDANKYCINFIPSKDYRHATDAEKEAYNAGFTLLKEYEDATREAKLVSMDRTETVLPPPPPDSKNVKSSGNICKFTDAHLGLYIKRVAEGTSDEWRSVGKIAVSHMVPLNKPVKLKKLVLQTNPYIYVEESLYAYPASIFEFCTYSEIAGIEIKPEAVIKSNTPHLYKHLPEYTIGQGVRCDVRGVGRIVGILDECETLRYVVCFDNWKGGHGGKASREYLFGNYISSCPLSHRFFNKNDIDRMIKKFLTHRNWRKEVKIDDGLHTYYDRVVKEQSKLEFPSPIIIKRSTHKPRIITVKQ
jgi:hypothetical protein